MSQDQLVKSSFVSKPEHHGTGRARTTDYLITTTFMNGAESLVRRTFEDFCSLQSKLVDERTGIIVPVLPDNKTVNRKDMFTEDFVSQRQEQLNRFLQRTIHHPELDDAPSLFPFFTASATDWEIIRDAASSSSIGGGDSDQDGNGRSMNGASTGAAGGLRSRADGLPEEGAVDDPNSIHIDAEAAMHAGNPAAKATSQGPVRRWWAAKRDQIALQKKDLTLEEAPAETKFFTNLQSYAEHLETCVRILSVDYKDVVLAQETTASKYETMAAAFSNMWGETELSNTSSSSMYQEIGNVWGRLSKRIQEHLPKNRQHLDGPLEDLIMDVEALKAALIKRKAAAFEFTKKTREGKSLNDQMNKLRQARDFTGQQDRYYALEGAIRRSDLDIEESKNRCALVSERLKRDVDRFRIEFHERMRQVLEIFHKQQVEYLHKEAFIWESALPSLAALDAQRSHLPTAPKAIAASAINLTYTTGGAKAVIESVSGSSNKSDQASEEKTSNGCENDLLLDLDLAGPPAAAPPPPPTSPPANPESRASTGSFDSVGLETPSLLSDDGPDTGVTMGGEADAQTITRPVMKSV
jgi:PX domain/Vps5 C terminal like